jgi:hypothetical protein
MFGPAAGETFDCEILGPRCHGVAHLLAESVHGERHPLTFDQSVVESGGTQRGDLAAEVNVRAVGENEGWRGDRRDRRPSTMPPARHLPAS